MFIDHERTQAMHSVRSAMFVRTTKALVIIAIALLTECRSLYSSAVL